MLEQEVTLKWTLREWIAAVIALGTILGGIAWAFSIKEMIFVRLAAIEQKLSDFVDVQSQINVQTDQRLDTFGARQSDVRERLRTLEEQEAQDRSDAAKH